MFWKDLNIFGVCRKEFLAQKNFRRDISKINFGFFFCFKKNSVTNKVFFKGFTIIEILTGISIIAIISGIFLLNFSAGREKYALEKSAQKLIQDLREIQQGALSPIEAVCPDGKKVYEFGIYFDENSPDRYLLFANCDESRYYNSGVDKVLNIVNFEQKIRICNLFPLPQISVVYSPPNPRVYINGTTIHDKAQIILWWQKENLNCLQEDVVRRKIIEVNKVGLIELK